MTCGSHSGSRTTSGRFRPARRFRTRREARQRGVDEGRSGQPRCVDASRALLHDDRAARCRDGSAGSRARAQPAEHDRQQPAARGLAAADQARGGDPRAEKAARCSGEAPRPRGQAAHRRIRAAGVRGARTGAARNRRRDPRSADRGGPDGAQRSIVRRESSGGAPPRGPTRRRPRHRSFYPGGAGHIYAFQHGGRWEPQLRRHLRGAAVAARQPLRGLGFNLSPADAGRTPRSGRNARSRISIASSSSCRPTGVNC